MIGGFCLRLTTLPVLSFWDETDGWPTGTRITMQLELGPTNATLEDGSGTWNGSAANALSDWNPYLDAVRFGWVSNSAVTKRSGDGLNSVFFSSSVFGDDFGGDTLAVTVYLTNEQGLEKEADVVVNRAFQFNSYRGPLKPGLPQSRVYDIHRVLLHEFGHVLGLGHPDENGDTEVAIMNSVIGDLDHLAYDDMDGARGLYGLRIVPQSVTVSVGQPISLLVQTNAPAVSFEATGLPAGLKINSKTGLITGTVTLSGLDVFATVTAHGIHTSFSADEEFYVLPDSPENLRRSFYFKANRLLVDEARRRIYASVSDPPAVAVIDATSLTLLKTIPVESEPFGMALSSNGRKLFVTEASENNPIIGVVSAVSLTSLPDLSAPFQSVDVASASEHQLFVTALETSGGAQIDGDTGGSIVPFPVQVYNGALRLSPDSKTLYAADVGLEMSNLFSFDTSSGSAPLLRQSSPGIFSGHVGDFKVSHDGTFLCVPGYAEGGVAKLSAYDITHVFGKYLLPGHSHNILGPFTGDAVAISPDDETVFVTGLTASPMDITRFDATIDLFNAANEKYLRKFSTGPFVPSDMVVDASGQFLFAASETHDQISQLRVYSTGASGVAAHPPKPKSLLNVSTRLGTKPGEDSLIGGFIITGTKPKKIALRGLGRSLPVRGPLSDPVIELYDKAGTLISSNDNWNAHRADVLFTGLAPTDEHEAALVVTLSPGSYTVVVRDAGDSSGIALVEAYDLTPDSDSALANISTRGRVETDDNVMIGGFIISAGGSTKILLRAIGPSLSKSGISDALRDPVLELHDGEGNLISKNDNWRSPHQAAIVATGIPPTDDREAALVATLPPGNYTAVVRGQGDSTGVALVEVYNLDLTP